MRVRVTPRALMTQFDDNYKRMNELSKESVNWLVVGDEAAGQRIDNFLTRILKGVPKSHIYRILRSGEVRVNKGRVGPDVRLVLGDRVRVPPIRISAKEGPAPTAHHKRAGAALRILFEDEALIAIDKPAGLAVHGGSGISAGLIEQLRAARPEARFLELVHRLDRDTSGVMLVAKKRSALVALHAQLREGGFDKRYLVLVRGRWRDEMRTVNLPLHRYSTPDGERRVRVEKSSGQAATTVFRRLETWPHHEPPLALLEAELLTGRTHQIRVHLASLDFPLAGDDKYGDFGWNKELGREGLRRMFLHARSLALRHPLTQESIAFESALPVDLAAYLNGLGPPG